MTSVAAVRLRCPDCAKDLGPLAGAPACPGCARTYASRDGVWNLLPAALGAHQAAEDALHAEAGLPTWRRLIDHKRYWLEWCETRWLPELIGPRTRTFLEIGGGLCYASALAKARAPDACVVATDVSPRYLRRNARESNEPHCHCDRQIEAEPPQQPQSAHEREGNRQHDDQGLG